MARPLRVEFAGAVYHVMARGNERKAVFRDDREQESDARVKIWVRVAGERNVAVARDYGYRGGSSVGQVVRRLEQQSISDKAIRQKLVRIRENLSRVES